MKCLILAAVLACGLYGQAQQSTCALPDAPVAVTRCEPFSIYVADFGRQQIESILNRHFDGFTILEARGCWKKICEKSLLIQVAGASETAVRQAAEELRVAGKQQSVLVVAPLQTAPPPAKKTAVHRRR